VKKSPLRRKAFTYTFGEFIDRLCIVSKKAMCRLPGAEHELHQMMAWCVEAGIDGEFLLAIIRVAQCNLSIWDLEHAVRNASEGSIPLAEVGRRAIMIRNTNRTRIESKNILDKYIGAVEEKIKHLSEDTYDKFYGFAGLNYKAKTREEGGEGE
jgi:hypothetical protein